ncbi:MAG: hypothetical protein ACE5IM_03925, partial [Nitrospinota bacterium]
DADRAFLEGLREEAEGPEVLEADAHINDPAFADLLVETARALFGRPAASGREERGERGPAEG